MKIEEFNSLDFYEKLKLVWSQGIFADTLMNKIEYIKCYSLNLFFVEVVYDNEQKEIIDVRPFEDGLQLDKYVINFNRCKKQ